MGDPTRELWGLPRYLLPFKIPNLQGPEEDANTPGSSHWSGEVQGRVKIHFSCFLLEDDGSSSVGSTAAIATVGQLLA